MADNDEARPFRRRRPPSRQATRLMMISVLSSLGLAAVLGVVFLPVLLQYEQAPKDPHYQLAAVPHGSQLRIEIIGASFPRELGAFKVLLVVDSEEHVFGPLPQGMDGLVSFVDDNKDGILNQGDYFLVEMEEGRTHSLLILHPDPEKAGGVGFIRWPP